MHAQVVSLLHWRRLHMSHTILQRVVSTGDTDLVSTYDLPDSKPTGWGGGGIPELTLVISNLKFYIGGGYSG